MISRGPRLKMLVSTEEKIAKLGCPCPENVEGGYVLKLFISSTSSSSLFHRMLISTKYFFVGKFHNILKLYPLVITYQLHWSVILQVFADIHSLIKEMPCVYYSLSFTRLSHNHTTDTNLFIFATFHNISLVFPCFSCNTRTCKQFVHTFRTVLQFFRLF